MDDEMPLESEYDSDGMDASIRVEPMVKRAYLTFTKVLGMSHPVARAVCAEGMCTKEYLRRFDPNHVATMRAKCGWTMVDEMNFLHLCSWLQRAKHQTQVDKFTVEALNDCIARNITCITSKRNDDRPTAPPAKPFNGEPKHWHSFRTAFECYFMSMSSEYECVLEHSPKRYALEDPADVNQALMAGISDDHWLFNNANNSEIRNHRVYETLKSVTEGGTAAEYINIPHIRDNKNGRLAWITLCSVYETKEAQGMQVDAAVAKMKAARYTGSRNFTFHQYVSIHQNAHMISERHAAHTKWNDHDKINYLLDGIVDTDWKPTLAVVAADRAKYTFSSLVAHLQGEANRLERDRKSASDESNRKARATFQGSGKGNGDGEGRNNRYGGKDKHGGGDRKRGGGDGNDGGGKKRKWDGGKGGGKPNESLDKEIWNLLTDEAKKSIIEAKAKWRDERKAKAARTEAEDSSSP